ncbi:hypothetical protein [Streptomyces yangpuensis]|uniref:hypothetical protein n=1 Tax=Streptomyces yangpuensis TaxID=1648182 RepID=UPI003663DABB
MLLVDHDHVHRRVVDLDLLQQIDHGRRHTPGWLQPAGRLAPLPRDRGRDRLQPRDPPHHRPPRRNPQPTKAALACDLPVNGRHTPALPRQVPPAQHLGNDRLDLIRQPPTPAATTGTARQ